MTSLTEKAGLLTLSNVCRRAATILSGIIVVRWLSQQDLGTFRQVNLIFSTSCIILLLGIPASLYYFLPRAQEHEKRGIITQTLITLGLIGLVSSIILFFLASQISAAFHNPDISVLIRRYSPYLVFYLPGAAYFAVMMCMDRVAAAAIGGICITLPQIVATIIPLMLHYSLLTIFTTMLITGIIVSMLASWLCLRVTPKGPFYPPKGFGAKQFKFSLPLGMSQVVSLTGKEIDKFFISSFFSVKDFAMYSVGAVELPITNLLNPAIRNVLLPKFTELLHKREVEELLVIWRESRRKLSLITFPIIILFFCIAPEFITFLYSNKYIQSASIFQIYLLIPLVENFESSIILHASGKPNKIFFASLVNVGCNIIISYVLIQKITYFGPCIATVIATIISFVVVIRWVCREIKVSFSELFPFSEYLRILIISFISSIPLFIFRRLSLFPSRFVFLILSSAAFFLILFPCYYKFVLRQEDLYFIAQQLSRIPPLNKLIKSKEEK